MAKWIIDTDHTVVTFAVKHFMVANVVGLFSRVTGTIQFDPPDLARLSVEAEIDVSSISTGNQKRDEHLLSPDYLDSDRYPQIIFKSARVEPTGSNWGRVTGDLTLRGVTRPVSFEMEFSGPVKSPFSGNSCIGFSATAGINREDFGMTTNYAMEGGGFVVGKEIRITFDVEADPADS